MTSATVYICENQPVAVEGLKAVFGRCSDIRVVGDAPEIELAAIALAAKPADILLVGQPVSCKSVLPLLRQVKDAEVKCAVVLWAGELSDMDCFRALQMGARGIVRRTQAIEVLLECVRTVAAGSVFLERSMRTGASGSPRRTGSLRITPREREVIEFVCRGMKNKEIAEALSITPGTVKVHLMHIFEKTGVKDRFQLALQGRELLGLVEEDSTVVRVHSEQPAK